MSIMNATDHSTLAPAGSSRPRAFTLIELVIVLVIVAIASAVAIPRFASASSRYRVDAAVQQIIADVSLTAAFANNASAAHTIRFEPADDRYVLVNQPSPANPATDKSIELGLEPFGVNLLQVSFGSDTEAVLSGHGLLTESGQLTVAVGREARRIVFTRGSTNATVQDLNLNNPTDNESMDIGSTGATKTFAVSGTARAFGT